MSSSLSALAKTNHMILKESEKFNNRILELKKQFVSKNSAYQNLPMTLK